MRHTLTFLLLLVLVLKTNAQIEKLNEYKYVIVATKFDYLKKPNQYQTSSLVKFLLKKNNFNVFLSDDILPADVAANRCLAATVLVTDDSSLFKTKNYIEFKDCYGNLIFKSEEGTSKYKDYKKAYQQAIRNAHKTMFTFQYKFDGTLKNSVVPAKENAVKKAAPKINIIKKSKAKPVQKEIIKTKETAIKVLYAQSKTNGFQLVNTQPKIVFELLNTSKKEVFVIKDKNGLFYKKNNVWIAEYYLSNKKIIESYQVKF